METVVVEVPTQMTPDEAHYKITMETIVPEAMMQVAAAVRHRELPATEDLDILAWSFVRPSLQESVNGLQYNSRLKEYRALGVLLLSLPHESRMYLSPEKRRMSNALRHKPTYKVSPML